MRRRRKNAALTKGAARNLVRAGGGGSAGEVGSSGARCGAKKAKYAKTNIDSNVKKGGRMRCPL